jgi:hypothetical protein
VKEEEPMGTYVFTVQAFDRDPPEAGGTINYTAADDCVMLYVYSTYQHEAITSRSRQLLMMGTWLPRNTLSNW